MEAKIAEIIGIIGVIMVLWAYFLLHLNKWKSSDLSYAVVNFISSCFILYSLYHAWNLPAALVEIAWGLISLYGIYKWLVSKRNKKI